MAIKVKDGNIVNIATYQFICNDTNDLESIAQKDYNFGSTALVLHEDEGEEIGIYIADKDKEWVKI